MTQEQFDSWAYRKLQDYLGETPFTVDEQPGINRVKAFLAGLEADRAILVKE